MSSDEKLDDLIYDLSGKDMVDYISQLLETQKEAQKEIREIEPRLKEIEDQDFNERHEEYWESQFGGSY